MRQAGATLPTDSSICILGISGAMLDPGLPDSLYADLMSLEGL